MSETSPHSPTSGRATAIGVLALLSWATLAIASVGVNDVPPFLMVALAFSIAAAIALAKWIIRGESILAHLRQPWQAWALGIFGLFDVASEMGFDKHDEDIGQTLAVWGVKPGPYFYWPVLGPRTLRDTAGYVADSQFDPVWQIQDKPTLYTTAGTRIVDIRAALLPADTILESAALDKYSYIRNAYLQRPLSQVYDGEPPHEPEAESTDSPQNAPDSATPTQ